MKRYKGFKLVTQRVILTALTVFFIILALVFFFTTIANTFKPGCWKEPTEKLKNLNDGETVVDFMGCVGKAVFTNDLNTVKNEIDIYEYCNEKDRLKDYGSFLVIIPAGDPKLSDAWKAWDKLTPGKLLKPVCLWRGYEIYKEAVFEGSGEKHCIHMEVYSPAIDATIKIISQC